MGRKRVIDTDELLFDEELFEAVGKDGLWLYVRLWSLAEDWGGYEPRYGSIALKTGILRLSSETVKEIIEELIILGKIVPYEANGKIFHWIKNFLKHQRLNNPTPPSLPLPPWVICEVKEYKSKKKYASFQIDWEKLASCTSSLPVGYQNTTSSPRNRNETETETETRRKDMSTAEPPPPSFSVQDLAILWNEAASPELAKVHLPFKRPPKAMTKMRDAVKRNPDRDWWLRVVAKTRESPFLLGVNDRGWKASIDFMIENAEVILDGKYDGGKPSQPKGWGALKESMQRRKSDAQ